MAVDQNMIAKENDIKYFLQLSYLGQAEIFAAGLDGIENKRKPGQRLDIDMYAELHKARGTK